jgi:hypothetical protein
LQSVALGFGIDFADLVPPAGRFTTDIRFDIEPHEDLRNVLNDLGIMFDTLFEEQN